MAFALNVLRALFGLGGGPPAQGGSTGAAGAPLPGLPPASSVDPGFYMGGVPDITPPNGQGAAPAAIPQSGQPAPAPGLIDPSQLPQLPTYGKRGALGDTLDNLFLGGAIQKARTAEHAEQQQDYATALQQAQLKAQQALLGAIQDPHARLAAILNPGKLGENVAANYGPQTVKAGESFLPFGSTADAYMAPQLDPVSGKIIQGTPGGGMITSPSAGGGFKVDGGAIISDRTGDVAGRVALPQKLAPGEHIGSFTPGVAGPTAAAGLPQLPSGASTAPGMPSPSDVLSAAPGATITSGFRTPAHNAEVHGVANSYHMTGTPEAPGALDIVPPTGMGMPALAARMTAKLPQLKVLNEGDHVHIQPAQPNAGPPTVAGPRTDASGSIIDEGAQTGPVWSPPQLNRQTNRVEQTNLATGEVRDAGPAAFDPQGAKQNFTGSEAYKDYAASNDAFKAMVNAAGLPNGGMRAYALRDTFARTINPGAVARVGTIQAIKEAQGVPANVKAYFMNLKGDGDVPPEVAQQILDVSRGFLNSHYATAKALNESNGAQASRYGLNPQDAMGPMDSLPGNVHLSLPPKNSLIKNDVYKTGHGLAIWTGTGFKRYGG